MRNLFFFILFTFVSLSAYADTKETPLVHDYSSGLFRFQHTLANKGDPVAQYKLGEMYEIGTGVTKDEREALIWFKKAAAQGHKKAIYKLLYLEIEMNGVSVENKKQLDLLKQQAESKNTNAQYYLGKMYASGVGVPKNLETALMWLNKATFNGDNEAEDVAIWVDEELIRIKLDNLNKRKLAVKKYKADKKQINARKKKQREKARIEKIAKEKEREKLLRQNELNKTMLEERELAEKNKEILRQLELALAEEEAIKREAEAAELKAAKAKKTRISTFQSDPCKGKSAKFLSICR